MKSRKKKYISYSLYVILFVVFFVCGFDARTGARNAGVPPEPVAASLAGAGYSIDYEVAITHKSSSIGYYLNAYNAEKKSRISVAVIKNIKSSPVAFKIYHGAGIKKLSDIARENGAFLAMNGGYYAIMKNMIYSVGKVGGRREGDYPSFIEHREYPYLCSFSDGGAGIFKSSEFLKMYKDENSGIDHYLQTKPLLIYKGSVSPSLMANREANVSFNPRSAVGYLKNGTIICVTVDGRQSGAAGMTQVGLALIFKKIGVEAAINLDGGGSSEMILNGEIMNKTSGGLTPFTLPGEERPIHSAVLFVEKK